MLDEAWALDPSVALRPEPFGALAYHFGTRKLVFLKRPELVAVVSRLGEEPTVRAALTSAEVEETSWPAYLRALDGLAESTIIRPREAVGA